MKSESDSINESKYCPSFSFPPLNFGQLVYSASESLTAQMHRFLPTDLSIINVAFAMDQML